MCPARANAPAGELLFGTVDSYLMWRLTGGTLHTTDASNASRTLLFDIDTGEWDDELLKLLRVPRRCCPRCRSSAKFGETDAEPVRRPDRHSGIAGDQQAATIGQACFPPGMTKSTYGTGCFALLNTGTTPVASKNRLLTTIAYQLNGQRTYALEGSIFIAGAAVQWLRDGLGIIKPAAETGPLADKADPERLSGAGLRRPRRALLESPRARRAVRADPQHRPQRARPRRAGNHRLPDRGSARSDARRLAGRRPPTCCASTAA